MARIVIEVLGQRSLQLVYLVIISGWELPLCTVAKGTADFTQTQKNELVAVAF